MPAGIITDATCGPICWAAREDTCRCSCGGARHGVLLAQDGAESPRRECRIDGVRYVLAAVGVTNPFRRWLHEQRDVLRERHGVDSYGYRYIPANLTVERLATQAQVDSDRWPEVTLVGWADGRTVRPYLYWVREDAANTYDQWAAAQQ